MRSSCSSQGRIRRRHVWRFVFPLIILVESGCPGALEALFVFQPPPLPPGNKIAVLFQDAVSSSSRTKMASYRVSRVSMYTVSVMAPPHAEDGKQWELDGVETGAERRRGGGDVYASLTPDITWRKRMVIAHHSPLSFLFFPSSNLCAGLDRLPVFAGTVESLHQGFRWESLIDFLIRFCMHAASLQRDLHCLYSSADHRIFSSSFFHKVSDVIYNDIISSVVAAE
jgi:hypothetical protein